MVEIVKEAAQNFFIGVFIMLVGAAMNRFIDYFIVVDTIEERFLVGFFKWVIPIALFLIGFWRIMTAVGVLKITGG